MTAASVKTPRAQTNIQPAPTSGPSGRSLARKLLIWIAVPVGLIAAVAITWSVWKPSTLGSGFVSGNGRIEATEIDIAAKLAGRVSSVFVDEGDFVEIGQPLGAMQIDVLDAQRNEARAQSQQAVTEVASAVARVAARKSDKAVAEASVIQHESDVDAAQRRLTRFEPMSKVGAVGLQDIDDYRAKLNGVRAELVGAKAQVTAAQAAVDAAEAEVIGARAGVAAAEATVARVDADIADSQLTSPRAGRIQYRIAEAGEVLPAGGKVLNLVDLSDVYITFFLPETAVGKVPIASEVRIVLDAAPQFVIPAKVSYVASVAQFTPKTVETASERQKLMFRVKARISRDLLQQHLRMVKTGLPGIAWLKLDPQAQWPANLQIKVPE